MILKVINMQKGMSILVSHAAFLAIGVAALLIISAMLWGVYDSVIREEIRNDMSKSAQTVAGEIVKLYLLRGSPATPASNRSLLLGSSLLELQPKAGGRQYIIELVLSSQISITNISEGNSTKYAAQITAYTTNPRVQVNYTLYNLDARVQGFGFGDNPLTLGYYRLNYNGTTEDRIVLNDGLVIGGENIG